MDYGKDNVGCNEESRRGDTKLRKERMRRKGIGREGKEGDIKLIKRKHGE